MKAPMRKPAIASVALAALLTLIASCGGGSSGTNVIAQVIATPGPPNVEPIKVDTGPAALSTRAVNIPYVTIKICDPTSGACQTIDHIEVDTGSSGLRILSQALSINLQVATLGGKAIAECTQFADGSSFGPLATVNLTLPTSGKTVSNLAIQVIGAPTYPTVPGDCPGAQENTVEAFGANGILGVGPFIQDCGGACASTSGFPSGFYYTCADPASCVGAAMPTAMQVSNPVNFFASDNNGAIVELPAVSGTGAASLSGSLVFGINTQSNNSFGSASVATASADYAYVQATYNGTVFDNGALDSGSNAVYFTDNSITMCTTSVGLYCPSSTLSLSATLKGVNSTILTAPFSVANAETELTNNPTAGVIPNIGGSIPSSVSGSTAIQFDLGLPFFYGRNVFTGMEAHMAGGYSGPFYAF
jgi:Protein of unknown function (DUF3443)